MAGVVGKYEGFMSQMPEAEYRHHVDTWNGFVRYSVIGTVTVAAVLVLMAIALL